MESSCEKNDRGRKILRKAHAGIGQEIEMGSRLWSELPSQERELVLAQILDAERLEERLKV